MTQQDEDSHNAFRGTTFAPDHLLREWADGVASVWSAMDPSDPKQAAADTRNDLIHGMSLRLIEDFCLRQHLGRPQSPETLLWLSEVLARIVAHKDPLHSLGLLPRPNRRPSDSQRPIDVVFWLRNAELRGHSPQEANGLAAECFSKDLKTIQGYRRQAGAFAESMTSDPEHWTEYFELRSKPLPAKKDGTSETTTADKK